MWWRLKRSRFKQCKGNKNREAMKTIVASGQEPGILAYVDDSPVGWCAVGPREGYPVLARSRILKPVDDAPVWSVVCFFVDKNHRRQGLTVELLQAVLAHAKHKGAKIIEGYPIEPQKYPTPQAFAWTGFVSAFLKAGFVECARRSPTRPIMRFYIV